MELYKCRTCKDNFPIEEIKNESVSKIGTGICKYCENKRRKIKVMENKAKKNPDNYLICGSCTRIQNKEEKNGRNKTKTITHCKFCGSSQLDKLSEEF